MDDWTIGYIVGIAVGGGMGWYNAWAYYSRTYRMTRRDKRRG